MIRRWIFQQEGASVFSHAFQIPHFLKISFFLENIDFRENWYSTQEISFFMLYNFYLKFFFYQNNGFQKRSYFHYHIRNIGSFK